MCSVHIVGARVGSQLSGTSQGSAVPGSDLMGWEMAVTWNTLRAFGCIRIRSLSFKLLTDHLWPARYSNPNVQCRDSNRGASAVDCYEGRVLVAGCCFVLREKYHWLVVDKPNQHGDCPRTSY